MAWTKTKEGLPLPVIFKNKKFNFFERQLIIILNTKVLASNNGQHLELFKADPLNALIYAMAMEKQKNGLEIAQKGYDHYFLNKESDDIAEQYGKVWYLTSNFFVNNFKILFFFFAQIKVYIWYRFLQMRWRLCSIAEPIQRPTRLLLPLRSSRPAFVRQYV